MNFIDNSYRQSDQLNPKFDCVSLLEPNEIYCSENCEICGGFGKVWVDRPLSDPQFGTLKPCPNINLVQLFIKKCGLKSYELDYSWGLIKDINNIGKTKNLLQQFIENSNGFMYIWGDSGLGKTRLLKTMVAESLRKSTPAAYVRMTDMMDNLRSVYALENPEPEYSKRIRFWSEIPVLCIDEFDRLKKTPYVEEKTFSILDYRYESAMSGQSITVIASNTDPRDLDSYLADRIFDNRAAVIHVTGISARPNLS